MTMMMAPTVKMIAILLRGKPVSDTVRINLAFALHALLVRKGGTEWLINLPEVICGAGRWRSRDEGATKIGAYVINQKN